MIERLRTRLFVLAWRLRFARRLMELTGCGYSLAMRRADWGRCIYRDWRERDPSATAELYVKNHGWLNLE